MNFKLSNKVYFIIQLISWIFYSIFLFRIICVVDDSEIVYAVMLCGIIMYMTLNQFVKNWYIKGRPLLLDWFRLSTFLFIILDFFGMIDGLGGEFNSFKEYVVKKEYVLPSVLVVFIGVLGLKISENLAKIFWNKKQNNSQDQINYRISYPDFFYFISILIALIQLYLMLSGEVGYGTFQENTASDISFLFQIVFLLSSMILSVYSIFKYLYKYKNSTFNICFFIYFGVQILYGFLSGMKESIITPFIIVLIPFLMGGNKIPKNIFYSLVFLGVLIYPLNDNYRAILRDKPSIDRNDALGIALVKTFDSDFSDNFSEGADSFSDRLSLFPYIIYTVENENSWNYYKNMDRYIYLPVAWILPRFIIPDKPKSETGEILNYMVRGWSGNSLSATTYGWAYFEGGYFYVLILFVFFGLFISYYQHRFATNIFLGLLMYIIVLVQLLKVESDIYFLISGILQSTLIAFIFYRVFIKRTNSKS
ncbi:O-antigen polymerase [Flavobacterium terrae]|uniref:Oligosaccharide repeat unit polymerase n=1 Tax=Flavobacterium terrae TaxID=415425 RepID=A0A1M6FT54_9FLAO|nr:O-antigen polymerase [Flavobacterium terrae]SHJ00894.1 hypothetical protein SAMN05444363_2331 [Flavobacterium terrae]